MSFECPITKNVHVYLVKDMISYANSAQVSFHFYDRHQSEGCF